jgi:ABC-2 type transport system permease protein
MRSEWIKFSSTRSTLFTLLASGLAMAAIGMIAAATSTGSVTGPNGERNAPGLSGSDPLSILLAGQTLVVLIIGVLGVMLGAREYGSGLARTTYAAVPGRLPVLVSRIVVFVSAALVVVLAGTLVACVGGNALLEAGDAATVSWGDVGVGRAVIGTVGYLVGVGVLGICLGTLTRSIGTGVGSVIALILVIPGIAQLILPDKVSGALAYLPSQAGTAFSTVDAGSDLLGVEAGIAVFLAWVLGMAVVAGIVLTRKDV